MENGSKHSSTIILLFIVFVSSIVVLLWAITPKFVFWLFPEPAQAGQFGDLFGSINSLFSGLAFSGVVIAILLQMQELRLQRDELRQTREELKRSSIAQDESQKALNKTIYSQSFRIAVEIIESPDIIKSRGYIAQSPELFAEHPWNWSETQRQNAEKVARSFETVGTMIEKGLIPEDYIIDTWCVPIIRNWLVLESYIKYLRDNRRDPYAGRDFELLAKRAQIHYGKQMIPPSGSTESASTASALAPDSST